MIKKERMINSLRIGDEVNDLFIIKFKKGLFDYTNGKYFKLLLTDSTGNITMSYWGKNNESTIKLYNELREDDVILINGKISEHKNKLSINVNEGDLRVLNKDEYDESDFIKQTKKSVNEMINSLKKIISEVSNPHLKAILNKAFSNEVMKRFINHPASIEIHHNWINGLLQHTLEVIDYCLISIKHHPEINKDLLITGALLHDIGKLEEITVSSRIKSTIKGQLIGHITIGSIMINKIMDELNTPDELRNQLLHLIVSHHGKKEFGSPKEPMTLEAIALNRADEVSSKLTEINEFINSSQSTTSNRTNYYYRLNRNILVK